ncbi:MAG: DUF2849 domain-containing protein [Phenylobacterium sp.]
MKSLTGNRLLTGEAVFWKDGDWVDDFGDADVFGDDDAAAKAEAHAKSQPTIVVDPYLMDLTEVEGAWVPVSYRDRLRALGPTNHKDHGKQAQGAKLASALQHAHTAARSAGRIKLIKR